MTGFENLTTAKNKLMEALGDTGPVYMQHMKKWFQMKCTKEEFDMEVRKLMSTKQLRLHNHLLLQLFSICIGLADSPPSSSTHFSSRTSTSSATSGIGSGTTASSGSSSSSKRKSRQHGTGFQPANLLDYLGEEKMRVSYHDNHHTPGTDSKSESLSHSIRYSDQEMYLPNESLLFGRLTYAAWENGLDAASMNAAQVMTAAVKQFLKNILTAVINQRKGYRVREGKFIYESGCPIPNPWSSSASQRSETDLITSRVAAKMNSVANILGTGVGYEMEIDEQYRPQTPLTKEQIEQNILISSTKVNNYPNRISARSSITLPELYDALIINRNIIMSHSVYISGMERLIGNFKHPSWDD